MNKSSQSNFILISVMILAAAFARLIPHWPNFTPIAAIGLFGAAHFKQKHWSFIIPLAAMWMSDLILNNVILSQYYSGFQWMGSTSVYLSFIVVIILGNILLRKVSVGSVFGSAVLSSIIFYVVTNFFVWYGSNAYPQTIEGLYACYIAAIPFFWTSFAADIFYSTLLFGSMYLISKSAKTQLG